MPLKEASLEKAWAASPRVKAFRLKVLGVEPFAFIPGQWVNFHLPIKADNPQRAYSIASPPNGPGGYRTRPAKPSQDGEAPSDECGSHEFETAITRVKDGPGSTFFHDARVGTVLKFEGPAGRFVLRDPDKSGAAFIATGTGLTPFRSMIPHLLHQGCRADVLLLFGIRDEAEILFREEFEELARRHSNFKFVPTLSRPNVGWKGERGYVQVQVEKLLKGRPEMETYVCGLKKMVDEVRQQLMNMGFERRRIYFEKYD